MVQSSGDWNTRQSVFPKIPCTQFCCFFSQDGCTSFDIALEAGKRIKTLKVANCQASSDKDKRLAAKHRFTWFRTLRSNLLGTFLWDLRNGPFFCCFLNFCISFACFCSRTSLKSSSCFQSPQLRTKIFDYIISELGSLQHMDEQIRFLMGQMLKKNLANMGAATTELLQELGQT